MNNIKKRNLILLLAATVILASSYGIYLNSQRIDTGKMTLIFEDTFDNADTLKTNWNSLDNGLFSSTGFYDSNQAAITDGQLSISIAKKDGVKGVRIYTSALRTKLVQKYGYFEIRAKFPKLKDFTASISLTTKGALSNTDPAKGVQIDIATSQNYPYPIHNSGYYYDTNTDSNGVTKNTLVLANLYEEYHTYGLLWTKEGYSYYLDGNKIWEAKNIQTSETEEYLRLGFDLPMSYSIDTTDLLKTFVIDSVKIYQVK